ncbi:hypothetical protein QFZ22_001010 [Streptomyces canus]|uniref:Uncharacterized protein n=1 Tax=Streptomyces canus TaxID=58343 RepID=A0AAW8F6L2_9ACTN|nr:hypothetical protein [Streptomyces canus]MDQ0905025.1 hypothetical protein [Streptomyces canus]
MTGFRPVPAHVVGLAHGQGDLQAMRVGSSDIRQDRIAVPHRHPHRTLTNPEIEHDRALRVLH